MRAVLVVSRRGADRPLKAREIVQEMDIPGGYAPQILSALVRAGILEATAGRNGGYSLAIPPHKLSLLRVLQSVEPSIERDHCILEGGPCDWDAVCPLHSVWQDLEEAVVRRLAATTFDQLAEIDRAIEMGSFLPPSDTHGHSVPRRGQRQRGRGVDGVDGADGETGK